MFSHTSTVAAAAGYEFLSLRTLLGPCCGDEGLDVAVDNDGAVFVAGKRGDIDLDRDGVVDIDTVGRSKRILWPFEQRG